MDLSGLQSSSLTPVSVSGAATALTAEGAKAFALATMPVRTIAPLKFLAKRLTAQGHHQDRVETVYEGEVATSHPASLWLPPVPPVLRAPWLQASSLLQPARVPCTLAAAKKA